LNTLLAEKEDDDRRRVTTNISRLAIGDRPL